MTNVASLSKLLPTYARLDVTFTDGEGSWLVDADGKRYLDLFAGSQSSVSATVTRRPSPPRTRSSTACGTCRTSTRPSRCRSSR